MTPSVQVQSVPALQDLEAGLNRFGAEAQSSLQSAEGQLRQAEEWLHGREAHWQIEVQRRQDALRLAEAALARCQASVCRDPKTGAVHHPPCAAERAAVLQAQARLREAQAELDNVHRWVGAVNQAAASFRGQAARLSRYLRDDLPLASTFLRNKIAELYGYLAAGPNAGPASGTPTSSHAAQSAGTQVYIGKTDKQMVPVDHIDLSDSRVRGPADFGKSVSADDMVDGFHKLEDVVLPAVAQGADGDYFYDLDQRLGLDYRNGYKAIYDAFFGDNNCIILDRVGNHYTVTNGYHRLFIAQQLGVRSVPARIGGVIP